MINDRCRIVNKKQALILQMLLGWIILCSCRCEGSYIQIDEIRTDMDAYCLTVVKGGKIEKFGLNVEGVIRDYLPGRDVILVIGTDKIFKDMGPVRGFSGSPVYIDGKLAGALAGGWSFSKEPFYMVTPIAEMLTVGNTVKNGTNTFRPILADGSKPLDFAEINRRLDRVCEQMANERADQRPFLVTSLPQGVCNELAGRLKPLGLVPVASGPVSGKSADADDTGFKPGSTLTIPLVAGDISMAVVGAVTEVIDDKVYAFGHGFIGYGPVDLPMATGEVHTIVSNMIFSFRLASSGPIIGAIRSDRASGIYGIIGAKPKMIPMRISINRYNDLEKSIYNCRLAVNRIYTPMIVQASVLGASMTGGPLPPEHLVKYKAKIGLADAEPICFENVSSGRGFLEFTNEMVAVVALLMNNPYREIDITALELDVEIMPQNIQSDIWSVQLSDSVVTPGQTVDVSVVLQSYRQGGCLTGQGQRSEAAKKLYELTLTIPDDLAPGQYDIIVAGGYGYENFRKREVPHKFTPRDMDSLIEAIRNVLAIRRDRLYLILSLPDGGIVIQQNELAYLPKTKTMLLQDAKRTTETSVLKHWLQEDIAVETIVQNNKTMKITVEK